jgi:acyl carrier protein
MKTAIRKTIKEHARLAVDIEQLGDAADLYQAGMTSHASVTLMLALENEFGIEFPDHMLSRKVFESVDAIEEAVSTLQAA